MNGPCFKLLLLVIISLLFNQCGKKKPVEPPVEVTKIYGTVRHAQDQSPIDSAFIFTDPHFYSTYSDSTGKFILQDLVEKHYLVIAQKDGFFNDTLAADLASQQEVELHFQLSARLNLTKWQFITDEPVYYSTPAIGDDGTIYVGTGVYLGTTSGSLYAINPDGTLKWHYKFDHNATTPVIGADGTIYVTDRKNVLYAFDPGGSVKWRYDSWDSNDFPEVGQRPVAIAADGTLYLFVGPDVYAINPDGTRKWKFRPPHPGGTQCGASAIVGRDGTIYVIPGGDVLLALNPDGTLKWEFFMENYDEHSYSSPSLDAEDVIYFSSENSNGGYVYAVYPTGILKWRILAGRYRAVRSSPTIGADGTIYVGTKAYSHRQPAELLAINPDGTIKWRFTVESVHFTPDDVYSTVTVGADGLIYFGAETGFIYALNPDGTLNWKQDLEIGINWCSPALLEDGTIYIGGIKGEQGALIALQSTSPGLAPSPWPTFRKNNKNTGRYDAF